jgi:hypothetical protein
MKLIEKVAPDLVENAVTAALGKGLALAVYTLPEAAKTSACSAAVAPSTSRASATARNPSRDRRSDWSIRPWLWAGAWSLTTPARLFL